MLKKKRCSVSRRQWPASRDHMPPAPRPAPPGDSSIPRGGAERRWGEWVPQQEATSATEGWDTPLTWELPVHQAHSAAVWWVHTGGQASAGLSAIARGQGRGSFRSEQTSPPCPASARQAVGSEVTRTLIGLFIPSPGPAPHLAQSSHSVMFSGMSLTCVLK